VCPLTKPSGYLQRPLEHVAGVCALGIDLAFERQTASDLRFFNSKLPFMETLMTWSTPAYIDLRFGFEITMYIANR
jgi:coenzyme PQQ precursor peptide PqqA